MPELLRGTDRPSLNPGGGHPPVVYLHGGDVLHVAEHTPLATYSADPFRAATTSQAFLTKGKGTVVIYWPTELHPWDTWLVDTPFTAVEDTFTTLDETAIEADPAPLPQEPPESENEIAAQLRFIQETTGLSDTQLAATLPGGVSRETVNRWRNRPDAPTPRPANVYRIGILFELAKRLAAAPIDPHLWLHQPFAGSAETPYTSICSGGLAEVRQAIEMLIASPAAAAETTLPAIDRGWDELPPDDDDGEWNDWDGGQGDD